MRKKTNLHSYLSLILLLFLSLLIHHTFAQSLVENINLPTGNGKGSMIGDIQEAGDHFFVYAYNKVVAYDNNGNYAGEVSFNMPEDYGKFNPFYFWDSYYTASTSFMAYNETAQVLYTISPALDIYIIDLDPDYFLEVDTLTPAPGSQTTFDNFKPLHGNCILKYDNAHERLYWLIDGMYPSGNVTGSHHNRHRYLFIYQLNSLIGTIDTELYEDYQISTGANYNNAGILDIEINQINDIAEPDYFYCSKINRLEVWKITKNPVTVSRISTYPIPYNYSCDSLYKTSLYYINDDAHNIHKIIAFPYKYPTCPPDTGYDIFILDGDHDSDSTSISWISSTAPNSKITDAVYLKSYQHLIFSHAADTNYTSQGFNPDNDISIFSFSDTNNNKLLFFDGLNTDSSTSHAFFRDYNTPIHFTPISFNSTLVCKEDEICYLYKSGDNYKSTSKLVLENNYFVSGVNLDNGNTFVLNAATNGIQKLNSSSDPVSHIPSGFQANQICMDNDGDKFYIFNRLNSYNTGCIVMDSSDAYNLNNGLSPKTIEAPVGDCIYNPFLDHFLISENAWFDDHAVRIKVFDNDQENKLLDSIYLETASGLRSYYARNMFITPNGELYVAADMLHVQGSHPKIFVFSALDGNYTLLQVNEINSLSASSINSDFYYAHFCYNHYNNKVYATINPQIYQMSPYSASSNGRIAATEGAGVLLEFDNHILTSSIALTSPGKIICPDPGNPDLQSRYGENMYIIGSLKFYDVAPPYNNADSITAYPTKDFNDITYSVPHDMLFALNDRQYDTISEVDVTHRVFSAFSIDYDSTGTLKFTKVLEEDGQAACIFSNPYNGQVYVHQKTDEYKLGQTPVSLLHFTYDSLIAPPNLQNVSSISLGIRSIYPEMDENEDYGFHLYNITSPVISPYDNTIYIPNGGHSCISKVSFDPVEAILLGEDQDKWSWLSFPRMERLGNEAVEVDSVLGGNRLTPNNYQVGSRLITIPPQQIYTTENVWNGVIWNGSSGGLDQVQSTLGYKLKLKYGDPPDNIWLYLSGSVFVPDEPDDLPTLYSTSLTGYHYENWIGYYLYQSQYPLDAFSEDELDHIFFIQGQYWTCAKFGTEGNPIPEWYCNCASGQSERLNYADMVIVKTDEQINNFQWQGTGDTPGILDQRSETENYTFTEQSSYTPIFIELDSAINPIEIGAFVEDSCVGATSIFPEDTMVLVPAYTEGISGEIYFESYYGTTKTLTPPITEYSVKTRRYEKARQRMIHTSDNEDYYLVSFTDLKRRKQDNEESKPWITCSPNPVTTNGRLAFFVPEDGMVEIKLYSIFGKRQNTLFSGNIARGKHDILFEAKDEMGNSLANGTYIISLHAAENSAQSKIVIINNR